MGKKRIGFIVLAFMPLASVLISHAAAQQPAAAGRGQQAPPPPMGFFVTSVGKGAGANLGGLAGADAHCQMLATAAGAGNRTWRAYLSTQSAAGQPVVNARDRIGTGPWASARGALVARDVAHLHGDTLELAQVGNALTIVSAIDEKGNPVKGFGSTPNEHDMLTGSQPNGRAFTDGMDHTCSNWTSSADGRGSAQVGHHDRTGRGNTSWNSAHGSAGCSQANLVSTGGAGYFYCFAAN